MSFAIKWEVGVQQEWLTVIERIPSRHGDLRVRCRCGSESIVQVAAMSLGQSSCGCVQRERHSWVLRGASGQWCARWRDSFDAFIADLGPCPAAHRIARINPKSGWWCGSPDCAECGPKKRAPNCMWAPYRPKPNTPDARLEAFMKEKRRENGISRQCYMKRIRKGVDPLLAATTPPDPVRLARSKDALTPRPIVAPPDDART